MLGRIIERKEAEGFVFHMGILCDNISLETFLGRVNSGYLWVFLLVKLLFKTTENLNKNFIYCSSYFR